MLLVRFYIGILKCILHLFLFEVSVKCLIQFIYLFIYFSSLFRADGPVVVHCWELCLSLESLWILSGEVRLCAHAGSEPKHPIQLPF